MFFLNFLLLFFLILKIKHSISLTELNIEGSISFNANFSLKISNDTFKQITTSTRPQPGLIGLAQATTKCVPCCPLPTPQTTTCPSPATTTTVISTTTVEITTTLPPVAFNEENCFFPFEASGVLNDKCATDDNGQTFWCSLDRVYKGRRAQCEQACPLLARNLMANEPGFTHTSCLDPSPSGLFTSTPH